MNWNKLLSKKRPIEGARIPTCWNDYPMDASDRDYMEIICNPSYRKMQDKSQLYLINRSDFVRTRLTHSMEVAGIGKLLGSMITKNTKKDGIDELKSNAEFYERKISTTLGCAGFLHDIGNPPFGHKGEDAISSWFKNKLEDSSFTFKGRPVREWLSNQMIQDLLHFDGNAQMVRILARPEVNHLNVSYALISTMLKYPADSLEADRSCGDLRRKKAGYFYSEKDFVKKVREATGVGSAEEPFARHPLTFLLEAADDIAYVVSDLEDAIDRKHITAPQLAAFLEKELAKIPPEGDELHQLQIMATGSILNQLTKKLETVRDASSEIEIQAFQEWTRLLKGWLLYVSAYSFTKKYEDIMAGRYNGDLFDDGHHRYTVQILKSAIQRFVYPSKANSEIMAYNIIDYLMEVYASAVVEWNQNLNTSGNHNLAILSIPENLKEAYLMERTGDEGTDLYLRFRMVIDFISGMTDREIKELYLEQKGLK